MGHFDQLILTIPNAFFTGGALAISAFACLLSLGFYLNYRKVVLLYFPVVVAANTLAAIYAHGHSPGLLHHEEVKESIAVVNILFGIATYAFYRLFLATIPDDARSEIGRSKTLKISLIAALSSRAIFIFYHPPIMDTIAAFFTTLFFAHCVFTAAVSYKTRTWAGRYCRLACLAFASGPLSIAIADYLPFDLTSIEMRLMFVFAISSLSIIWVFAIIAIMIEEHEKLKLEKLRGLATAYMRVRDVMNTPLQTITWAVDLIREDKQVAEETIASIDTALRDLSVMNRMLSRHEKNIDWQSTPPA